MTRIAPGARWRPITANVGPRRAETIGFILHCAASNSPSLYGWFNNPAARASSTFFVRKDGVTEQYVDADATAYATRAKSRVTLSAETQNDGSEPWTDAQCEELARLIAWGHEVYGYPIEPMPSSKPGTRGVGYHAQGCPKWPARGMPPGYEQWGPVGKTCPGPKAIAQIPGIIARARTLAGLDKPIHGPEIHRTLWRGMTGADVRRYQTDLAAMSNPWWRNRLGTPDGSYGLRTKAVTLAQQIVAQRRTGGQKWRGKANGVATKAWQAYVQQRAAARKEK